MARSWVLAFVVVAGCSGGSGAKPPDAGADAPGAVDGAPDASPPAPKAQLLGVSPAVALSGGVVTLEGTFPGPTMVHLPGGTSALATVLGPHRATVTVPPGTTLGSMRIDSDGVATNTVSFHAVTFPLGMRAFETYEQGEGARQPALLDARYGHASITLNNTVYVIGGTGVGTFLSEVDRALLDADGSLSGFAPVPNVSLVKPRSQFASVRIGDYLYVFGGLGNDDETVSTFERAPISPDETLGTFELVTTIQNGQQVPAPLAAPRVGATAQIIGNHVYLISGSQTASLERATILPDGTLGTFELVAGGDLQFTREGNASVVLGDKLYVLGGSATGIPFDNVEVATIDANGDLGAFSVVPGVKLLAGLYGPSVAVLGDGLYVFGGGGDYSNPTTLVGRAQIHADGTIENFESSGIALDGWRMLASVVFATNYVYVIGGARQGGVPGESRILRATINGGHSLGSSTAVPSSTLATATYDRPMISIGSAVYTLGGTTDSGLTDGIQRATVTNGTLDTFATLPGVTLATPRAGFATAMIGNYVYVLGGITSDGAVATIERAQIQLDGSLGAFAPYTTTSLTTARAHHGAVIVRGYSGSTYLYVLGGTGSDGTYLNTLEVAPIGDDGSLGAFVTKPGYGLTTARAGFTFIEIDHGVVDSRYVFAIGGDSATGVRGDVERAAIQANGTLGPFVPLAGATLATARSKHAATVIGDRVYVLGGSDGTAALDTIESSDITMNEYGVVSLSAFASSPGVSLTEPRSQPACMTIGNQLYTVGGVGSTAPLTSVEQLPLY